MGKVVYETREYKISASPEVLDQLEKLLSHLQWVSDTGTDNVIHVTAADICGDNFTARKDDIKLVSKRIDPSIIFL